MPRCRSGSERLRRCGVGLIGLLVVIAGLSLPMRFARADGTLFDALGGAAGLRRIVHMTLQNATHDPRIAEKFDNINVAHLELRFTERLCAWTGGPCTVHGPSMKGAHAELGLSDRHFNALVEDLETAMDETATPYAAQNRLLALLAPMHRDIVSR